MKLNKRIILKKIEKNKSQLKKFGVKSLSLFGSYAINKQKKDSDIDFLVEFEKGRGKFEDLSTLQITLEDMFKTKIDLVKPQNIREEIKPHIFEGKRYAARI